ncbi:MAG: nuclease-related domain-containing protein, partial [Hydrogenoanaerobacterium sp.]
AVITVIVLAYDFLFHKDKSGNAEKSGNLSAASAAAKPLAVTKRFALLQQYQVIAPAHLAKNGKFADLDFILVGIFGLLCVKCVGLGGEIYGNMNDDNWLQVQKGVRKSFPNPLAQAEADTRLVRDTLFTAKLKNVPVETIVIFTNKKAALALPRSTGHYTPKAFKALLRKSSYLANKGVDIAKATDAVRAYLTQA